MSMENPLNGTGLAYFWSKIKALLNNKVDKVSGKGLSTNDYTTAEKTKLAGIAAGAQVNAVTGVKGGAESSYRTGNVNLTAANVGAIPNDAAIMQGNDFLTGHYKSVYLSKADNALYRANRRWPVTATLNGAAVTNTAALFDGSYETRPFSRMEAGDVFVVTLDFSGTSGNSQFPGYPYGYFYVSFYSSGTPASVSGRVYNNYASHGVGWHELDFTAEESGRLYKAYNGYYGLQKLEITIVGSADNAYGYTSPCQIELHLTRGAATSGSMLTKYGGEKIYGNLTVDNLIGTVNGFTIAKSVPSNAVFTDTTYTPASAAPLALGAAAVGSSVKYAREDHVHPKPSLSDLGAASASDLAALAARVTALETALTGKADADHTHEIKWNIETGNG